MKDPISPMPIDTRDNELLRDIIADSGVSQVALAGEMHCSESYISRVLDGQYAVPASMTRALFKLTGDDRLLAVSLGVDGRDQLVRSPELDRDLASLHDRLEAVLNFTRIAKSKIPQTGAAPRLDVVA